MTAQQQLDVNLSISIPEDKVLVSKVELQTLKEQQLSGVYWSMKEFEERTGKKQEWLKENILYRPKFKKELEGFVYYPQSQGQTWSFQAKEMAAFLDKNFNQIFNGD
ncbi:DUF771 domain-containing protein [Salicibibacter cibarius]|uniref:DUF771 domain-containing protein n=1 Tax=Salicibibacter cibarius TaxID=2743000 RepID=A0A7T6Z176_9BACI|nr:DUF771 domain-containing protein [Salicibibacter cibarius]QQK75058.1 DUF771 domain-containing protein [Salicibibacter cibarius]QQK75120.1 DUF771 domain-containing protein [Salicibibacter cibarius]